MISSIQQTNKTIEIIGEEEDEPCGNKRFHLFSIDEYKKLV